VGRQTVRVAAVQWRFRPARDAGVLLSRLDPLVEGAAKEGALLVALPPFVCLALLEEERLGWWKVGVSSPGPKGEAGLRDALLEAAEAWGKVARQLATRHKICLVAGSCLELEASGVLRHRVDVWGPDGALRGTGFQTHPSPQERSWGVGPAAEVEPVAVAGCNVGLLVGDDVRYPEVSRILSLQGANLLVHLWAGGTQGQAEWCSRLWREVQANQVFGVEAALVGGPLGKDRPGRAAVLAPLGLNAQCRDGVLASSAGGDDQVVVATLDFGALQATVDGYPIFDVMNLEQYERYFPGIYLGGDESGDGRAA